MMRAWRLQFYDARFSAQFGESLAAATGTIGAEEGGLGTLSQINPLHTTNLTGPRKGPLVDAIIARAANP